MVGVSTAGAPGGRSFWRADPSARWRDCSTFCGCRTRYCRSFRVFRLFRVYKGYSEFVRLLQKHALAAYVYSCALASSNMQGALLMWD
eukprot:985692-Pyramimonas_sp.AAC.1